MEKHINVCLLNDSFPPIIDGVANAVLNYARNIHSSHGSVVVSVPRYPGEDYEAYPFPVISYPSLKTPKTAGYRTGIPIPGLVKEIMNYPVDIIHCHCPFISAVIAKSLRRAADAPVIMTYHTKFDIDFAENFDLQITRDITTKLIVANISACDEVWAVSRGAGENLRSLGYTGEYVVMENGVDFPKGTAGAEQLRAVSREHGLDSNTPVFLYVGRMRWYKGIRLILDGLLKAKAAGAKFKMVFVGDGDDFSSITQLAADLGLQQDCVFVGSVSDRNKLRAYYSRADMFLFPSTFDTSGLAVGEAAACGTASILVQGSAVAEPVTDRQDAVLIDEDSDSLAGAVLSMHKNRNFMKTLGRRAMETLYLPWSDAVSAAYKRYGVVRENYLHNKANSQRKKKTAPYRAGT